MRDVEPGQIHQLERPHPEPGRIAKDRVDLGNGRHAFAQHGQGFRAECPAGVVDDEAGRVGGQNGAMAETASQIHKRPFDIDSGVGAADDLDELHRRHGIEEVIAGDTFRPFEVYVVLLVVYAALTYLVSLGITLLHRRLNRDLQEQVS